MDTSESIFSYFVGGLALVSAIISTILYYRIYLPEAQIKILDDLLRETKDIYKKADADGLLEEAEAFRNFIQTQLLRLVSFHACWPDY